MRKQSSASAAQPLELHALAVFARVVDARSFSAAARSLATTTSAVSKAVARLEGRLGVRLLARTTRRVTLTEAGATFYAHVTRILRGVDDAEAAVAALGSGPRGTLRLSAPVIFGERHVAPLLPGLLARHAELRVDLVLSDRFVNLVEEAFDVAVRIGASPSSADATLVGAKVGDVSPVVCAAPTYFARHGTPRAPADLVRHNCLRYSLVAASREWSFRARDGRDVSVPVTGNLEVNHGGAMVQAAAAGLGVARVPHFLVRDALRAGELVEALADFQPRPLAVHLVWPRAPQTPPKVRAFVDYARPRLRARL